MPSSSRWPRRQPDTNQSYYYVDNRNASSQKMDRVGPYIGDYVPTSGSLQVPSLDARGNAIMVDIDARIWLPLESGAKARSVVTDVTTNASFTIVYAQQWSERIEAFVRRATPS